MYVRPREIIFMAYIRNPTIAIFVTETEPFRCRRGMVQLTAKVCGIILQHLFRP